MKSQYHTCSKCGGRRATPEPVPDLKPYIVLYDHHVAGLSTDLTTVVYAVDEEHARELAPRLDDSRCNPLPIQRVKRFPGT